MNMYIGSAGLIPEDIDPYMILVTGLGTYKPAASKTKKAASVQLKPSKLYVKFPHDIEAFTALANWELLTV
jgi:hypothetical protein